MDTTPKIWADPDYDPSQLGPLMPAEAAADAGPPSMPAIRMGGGAPPVFAPGPAPVVTRQPSPIETQIGQTSQRLQDLQKHDNYDFSQHSKLRNIGHVLSKIGNVAGDIFAPSTMELIPGTDLNRQAQEGSLSSRLQALAAEQSQNEERGATTSKTAAETAGIPEEQADTHALKGAQTGNLESETEERLHPHPQYEVHDTQSGPLFVNKQTGQAQHLSVDGMPVGPKIQTETVQLEIAGKPHQVLTNKETGEVIKDLGPSGIKPPVTNVNAGEAALDREAKQFGATHQKSLEASNAQLEKIADARAMINGNAESQGLGIPKVLTALVGGQGTGVRITQAELQAIATARGVQGDIEGTLNKWAGKGALTKEQQKQLTQIMDDVKARLLQKQAIASGALDTINGASRREQIIAADKDARQKLSDLEKGGGGESDLIKVQIPGQPPGQIHASQKAAFLAKYPNAKVE